MPELPEVQTIVNDLNAADLIGRAIREAKVYWPKTIATSSAKYFCRQIAGKTIATIQRRAKLILMGLNTGQMLAVHLRMTGRFQLDKAGKRRCKHVHVTLKLDDGRELRFYDTRKFGRFYLLDHAEAFLSTFGPEPLASEFTSSVLARRLYGRCRQIKPLLLDQTFIAGLGNIYVDEALWASRIHPQRRSDTLLPKEIKSLHGAIRRVLRQGLKHAGTTLGRGQSNFYSLDRTRGRNENYLKVFRRTAQPCPRCAAPIVRIVVGQRSTHVCETCQRSPWSGEN